MLISQFLSNADFSIQNADSIQQALEKLQDLLCKELVVLNGNDYIGLVNETILLDAEDEDAPLSSLKINTAPTQLKFNQHPYDALVMMTVYNSTIVPILDQDNKYIGVCTQLDILKAISLIQSQNESGAIIVLAIGLHDFSLSQIAHLVESDNCRILNCATKINLESDNIEVTLKIDKSNINALLNSFLRHNYLILETHNTIAAFDDTADRYQQLMNYINI
ncbi:CBS domain-containing protein [Sphingobacterium sp. Lzh-3]|jgi:signal-transduction protein with cAMP-binding, CBS, and nucleotidyltransferase domain|uniref:CBS domain-containing protein n=1 Tax=unclassified Sphingobacterium TaxID=2609468 RepID=UPI002952DBE9|nr:CBS domain-containing protein [Sphingobacterium sp. UGAL515B_05]WON94689.1 CBS domain-containing protein [Sphingobacterium sp. UGAL515B_05]